MSDKPRRAWFQIHLSTAIVLMFVAGGLLWANVVYRVDPSFAFAHDGARIELHVQGWPLHFDEYTIPSFRKDTVYPILPYPINMLTALAIFGSTALVCEFIIRRREARAP